MELLGLLVVGLVIGAVARFLRPGRSRLSWRWTFALGLTGAVVGGCVASAIGTGSVSELNVVGTLAGVLAAMGLIGAAEGLVGRDK